MIEASEGVVYRHSSGGCVVAVVVGLEGGEPAPCVLRAGVAQDIEDEVFTIELSGVVEVLANRRLLLDGLRVVGDAVIEYCEQERWKHKERRKAYSWNPQLS